MLDGILDQLIPANPDKGIPSAGQSGVGDFIELRVNEDTAIAQALTDLLSHAPELVADITAESVAQLERDHAASFTTLLNLTYMGYYSRPEMRALVGVASWPVHPKGYDVPAESAQLLQQLTAPVVQRGSIYRQPATEQQGQADE